MARMKTAEKRALILETAKRLLASKNADVSVGQIADAIGIPVGSIYTYFDSKQSLVETIIEEGWNEFRTWTEEGLAACKASAQVDDVRAQSLRSLSFLVNKALPKLFSDVDLIMLLLAETDQTSKLEVKLQYLAATIADLVSACTVPSVSRVDPRQYHMGITVLLLGALETLRIASKTDITIGADDILAFFKQIVETALGQALPDMG
jgi:AcrR family transcriptional regulator